MWTALSVTPIRFAHAATSALNMSFVTACSSGVQDSDRPFRSVKVQAASAGNLDKTAPAPFFDVFTQGMLEKPPTLTRIATLKLRVAYPHQIRVSRDASELVQELPDEANEYQIVRHVSPAQLNLHFTDSNRKNRFYFHRGVPTSNPRI
jgi:hypothetical protein